MIGIVILNYNCWDMTIDCIESIKNNCSYNYKIYIVDNASAVPVTEYFKEYLKKNTVCKLIINQKNLGYSAGNNVGIKNALEDGCDYVLISNNDVIFEQGSIELLRDFLCQNTEYGVVGPKVYLPDGSIQEINMGCKMDMIGKYKYILRKTPLGFLSKGFVKKFHMSNQDLNNSFDVYAVSGCCFMISRKALDKLYPMDENTFLYEEENILGVRMEKIGLKTRYYVPSHIIHMGGVSMEGFSSFAYKCFVESEIYYCRKYLQAKRITIYPLYFLRTLAYLKRYGKSDYKQYKYATRAMLNKKLAV